MARIVTLTMNPVIDIGADTETVEPHHKLRCSVPHFEAGGGGINVARVVKRLGGDPVAVYPSGGRTGELLHDLLEHEVIEECRVPMDEMVRLSLTVSEEATGDQFRFVFPGPQLAEDVREACLEEAVSVEGAGYLVLSGSLPRGVPDDFYAVVILAAKERGLETILDTSGRPLKEAIAAGVHVLKPNSRELALLTARELAGLEDHVDAARELIEDECCQAVLVSLAEKGAVLVTAEDATHLTAPRVEVDSAVGAGDSMVGAMATALDRGDDLLTAARWGVAGGTAAIITPGSELCRPEDVKALFEKVETRPVGAG